MLTVIDCYKWRVFQAVSADSLLHFSFTTPRQIPITRFVEHFITGATSETIKICYKIWNQSHIVYPWCSELKFVQSGCACATSSCACAHEALHKNKTYTFSKCACEHLHEYAHEMFPEHMKFKDNQL